MWTLHTKNPDHWVPIETVASFKRMREYQARGNEWVAKALRLSTELEVDETNTNVRRRTEVKEPKGQFERSVYAVRPIHARNTTFFSFWHRKGFQKRMTLSSSDWNSFSKNMARPTPCE